jgi:glycerol-3-phosphate dehydrogenase
MGGKWTTYRRMAEDVVNQAAPVGGLAATPSRTAELRLHGCLASNSDDVWTKVYGTDWPELQMLSNENPIWGEQLHPRLPFLKAEVIWAARWEMARTVEDVLARRTRALFLDARACHEIAPVVATLLAQELNQSAEWETRQVADFQESVTNYIWDGAATL